MNHNMKTKQTIKEIIINRRKGLQVVMIQIDTAQAKALLQSNDLNELQAAAIQWGGATDGTTNNTSASAAAQQENDDDHDVDPQYHQQILKLRILLQSRIIQLLLKNDSQDDNIKNKSLCIAYYDIGNVWMELGDANKAIGQYTKSIEYQCNYIPAYIGMADSYSTLTKTNDAIQSIEKAIELQKQQLQQQKDSLLSSSMTEDLCLSYVNLAEIYEHTAQFDKAIETLQIVIHTVLKDWTTDNITSSTTIQLEIKSMIYSQLGTIQEKIGEYNIAIISLSIAVETMNICYGHEHPKTQEIIYLLEIATSLAS